MTLPQRLQLYELNFPEHIHKYIEIVYVYDEFQRLNIDGTDYTLTKGNATLIFPDTVHSYKGLDKNKPNVLIIMAAPKLFGKLFGDISRYKPDNPIIESNLINDELRFAFEAVRPDQSNDIRFSWTYVILSYLFDLVKLHLPSMTSHTK